MSMSVVDGQTHLV